MRCAIRRHIVAGERWWWLFGLALIGSPFGIAAWILARFAYASMPLGSPYAEGVSAALLYVAWILTTLWTELVNTAAAFAWTSQRAA